MVQHKLIRQGKGEQLWGKCSCGMFAWLGTYHMPKGRLATLRAEHAKHVQFERDNPTYWADRDQLRLEATV